MSKFLMKIEDGKALYVRVGEWGEITAYSDAKTISDKNLLYVMDELSKTEPRMMSGFGGVEEPSLPSEIHRLAEISYAKIEAHFELRLVDVDFIENQINTLIAYQFHVKQWPEGYVRITEI